MSDAKSLDNLTPANDHGRCPICSRPGVASYRPFCSKRCADVDLARWLGGNYVIPGGGADDEDGDGMRDSPDTDAPPAGRDG
ncbi:MAG: DNA gyrase inhibitor YacG [Hyphomicrobiaceae bacterium]|nr:DNA gyrase inhibitor YacG [Hyphomicrobiaceae bacterium]